MNKENVFRNLDNVKSVLKATRAEIERVDAAAGVITGENDVDFSKIASLSASADEKTVEAKAQKARKADLEGRLHALQDEVKRKRTVLISREKDLKSEKVDIIDIEKKLRDSKEQMEKYLREYDSLFRMTQKLTEDLEVQIHLNDTIDKENASRLETLEDKGKEFNRLATESSKVQAAKKVTDGKIGELEKERMGYEKDRDELKLKIETLVGSDIKSARKQGEIAQKGIDEKKGQKEILTKR